MKWIAKFSKENFFCYENLKKIYFPKKKLLSKPFHLLDNIERLRLTHFNETMPKICLKSIFKVIADDAMTLCTYELNKKEVAAT